MQPPLHRPASGAPLTPAPRPAPAACRAAKLNPITLVGDGTAVQHVFLKSPLPGAAAHKSKEPGAGGEGMGLWRWLWF